MTEDNEKCIPEKIKRVKAAEGKIRETEQGGIKTNRNAFIIKMTKNSVIALLSELMPLKKALSLRPDRTMGALFEGGEDSEVVWNI